MTPQKHLDVQIASSIHALLSEHAEHPFHILRESGAVAALRALLLEQAPFSKPVTAHVRRRGVKPEDLCGQQETLRVQMEVTVLEDLEGTGDQGTRNKTVDLAVLSESPVLLSTSHGEGDVLQRMPATSLAAAIELKACPANLPAQKGLILHDILALLQLREAHGITGHFVLLDKAQSLYGQTAPGKHQPMVWDDRHQQTFVMKEKGRKVNEFQSFQSAGLKLDSGQGASSTTPFVTCWFLAPGQDGRWHVDSRQARRG